MNQKKYKNPLKQDLMEKILLHLADCVDFGFSYKAQKEFGIYGADIRSLIKTNGKNFADSVTELNKVKFINKKENYDGSVIISLTDKGKLRALNLRFRNLQRKKESWDGKWRMVAFDIPEEFKKGRNALRYRIKTAGFHELQESLFLYPYDCEKEIKDFVELFKLRECVRFALLNFIDNQDEIKRIFKLI